MRQKGQKRRLVRLMHRCGHETTEITETFPAGGPGEQKLRREHMAVSCGQCFVDDGPATEYAPDRHPGTITTGQLEQRMRHVGNVLGHPVPKTGARIYMPARGAE